MDSVDIGTAVDAKGLRKKRSSGVESEGYELACSFQSTTHEIT